MSTLEQLGGGKVVQPPPALATPPRPQQQQPQQQQFCPDQHPKRRSNGYDDSYRRSTPTKMPSLSTRGRLLAGIRSRPVSARPSKLRQHNPTRSGFLLLVATILTGPSLWSVSHGLFMLAGGRENGSGSGIGGIGVGAEDCSPHGPRNETVGNGKPVNYSMFACENGEFNVSWVGVVNVSSTIKIGLGTTVRIFGESPAARLNTDSTYSNSNITTSSQASNSSDGGRNKDSVDMELELETLSKRLNLPQELTSAAVGSVVLGHGNSSDESFGPIFFVDGGELHLELLVIRRGYSVNSSLNDIVNGGGIHAINSTVSVSGCLFQENFAFYLGGGIHANRSTLTFKDTIFRGNRAGFNSSAGDEDADSAGGGIACENSNLYLDGCLFDDNYANKKGGGVHTGVGRVSVVDSLFFNNLAGSDNVESEDALGEGAALSFTECTRSFDNQSSCGVNDTTFIYNAAAKKGAAVAVGSGDGPSYIEFHRCVVDNSTTGWPIEDDPQGEGGAFAMGKGTTLVLEDCVVKNNYCGKKGGAITLSSGDDWVNTTGATVIMRNSTFTGNFAELDVAGVIYLGEFATARIEGRGNNFTRNVCGLDGGVLAATTDTRVVVEGGLFEGNEAGERGGVFWVKGNLNITGGNFSENEASEDGGVVLASDGGAVILSNGNFERNVALDGGVVFVSEDAVLLVQGGVYSENKARNGGGAFWAEEDGDLEITGGIFTSNKADFGGFLYVEGDGTTSCEGASVVKHSGVDGGAIYAVDGAVVDWACHLIDNDALSGPAIYAREGAEVTVRGVNVSDNLVARGSVIFVVSSTLYTYRVNLTDSTGSADLSAVQSDSDSTYIAEETSFVGFEGETVVYSEGILYLDDCDFSQSTASALVHSDPNTTTVIRNAVLGDSNFEAVIEEASAASMLPVNASLINVALACSLSGSPCSAWSPCLAGALGVYCQCYVRNFSKAQMCLDGDPGGLSLTNKTDPPITFYPNLLEGDLVLTLDADDSPAIFTSPTSTVSSTLTSSSTFIPLRSLTTSGGVMWNILAMSNDLISWAVFPSVGLLLPGETITVRVASLPSVYFDGTTTATFAADALGVPDEDEEQRSNSLSTLQQTEEPGVNDEGDNRLEQDMEVTFYHCKSGNFWNMTSSENGSLTCLLCTDIEGKAEGLDCSDPGASTLNLHLKTGYWRASLDTTVVRECFNQDACIGGIATSIQDYCDTGYEGPYCGVCATGYGRGSANACYKCTKMIKGVMYSVLFVGFMLTVVGIILIGIYLVGGRVAVSQTVVTTRESVRMLQRRSSGLFPLSKLFGDKDTSCKERSAFGRDFSKMSSSRQRMIFGGGSVAVPDPSSTNAAVSALSSSSAVPAAIHTATDGRISGRGSAARRGDDICSNNSGADDIKEIDSNGDPSLVGVFDASSSPTVAADSNASGRVLLSRSARVRHLFPELTSSPALASAPASAARASTPALALTSAQEKTEDRNERYGSGDGRVVAGVVPSRLLIPAPAPAPATVGERGLGGSANERWEDDEEEDVRDDNKEVEKLAATIIGEFLGRLPLSKLKIVIVVWQISSAFAEITKVPFPGVYDKFLSFIGIFTFDLGWILSAACLTVDLDFYDELLIVTIGPVFLLSLLGITFYLGSRSLTSSRRCGSHNEISNKRVNQNAMGLSSSGATALSISSDGMASPEQGATIHSAAGGVGKGRAQRRHSNSISMNTNTNTNIDSNITTGAGIRNTVSVNSSVDRVTSDEPEKGVKEVGENDEGLPTREGLLNRRRSVRRIWKDGPGDDADSEQALLWRLFARHTTMTLIILYLVYSTVSTVVFQTFSCEVLDEIGKHYLRADLRIECDTPKHKAYMIYAAIMICVYPLGIPTAFWYFLARHKSRINPPMDENIKGLRGEDHVVEKKVEKRKDDATVAPTSFLWAAYYPDRYYFEVCECIRRLLLTGVLVFMSSNTPGQVAFSCLFAFISLVAFELLRPHMDQLDRVLYRTGSLVVVFTNFLALIITADVADPDSKSLAAYAVGLIIVNIFFVVLSISWNTWATIKATFSERHGQGMTFGLDIVGEDKMDAMATAIKAKGTKECSDAGEDVKADIENFEAGLIWEQHRLVAKEPIDTIRIGSSRHHDGKGRGDNMSNSIAESVFIPPNSLGAQAAGTVEDSLSASKPNRRRYPLRQYGTVPRAWVATLQNPSSIKPTADSIFDRSPTSRGFPYASRIPPATPSAPNPPHAAGIPMQPASLDTNN